MRFKSRQHPLATRARRLFSSYAAKVLSVCLTTTIVGISIALIAGTAATLDWVDNYYSNGNGLVTLKFENYTAYGYDDINNATWTNTLDYKPEAQHMGDVYALLVAGVFGTVGGVLLLAISCRPQRPRVVQLRLPKWKTRTLELTNTTLTTAGLDAGLALTFLIVAVTVRVRQQRSPWLDFTYPYPDHHMNHTIQYDLRHITYENWNCGISYDISRTTSSPSFEQIDAQCHRARANRRLTTPLLVLALLRLSLRPIEVACAWVWRPVEEFLEWKKHTREMKEGRGTELHDVRGKRVGDEEEGGHARDSMQEDSRGEEFIAELPGWRMSRTEMNGDAAVTEMPGAEGGRELDAGVAAVEKDAGGKT